VLWNSATSRPAGIEYEVMDMVYRLPFRDWLRLDTPQGQDVERAGREEAPAAEERPARREAGEGRRRPGR
jgi:beta-lactamase class C